MRFPATRRRGGREVGTLLEERKLVHEFGDAYRAHQERVSMFVPLKWLRSWVVG